MTKLNKNIFYLCRITFFSLRDMHWGMSVFPEYMYINKIIKRAKLIWVQSWINFWNLIFWVTFCSFLFASNNFIRLLFISEMTWLVLYNYFLMAGSINDDITLISTGFFILAFAGLEFCIGMLLIIIFKKILKFDYFDDQPIKTRKTYNLNTSKNNGINDINVNVIK